MTSPRGQYRTGGTGCSHSSYEEGLHRFPFAAGSRRVSVETRFPAGRRASEASCPAKPGRGRPPRTRPTRLVDCTCSLHQGKQPAQQAAHRPSEKPIVRAFVTRPPVSAGLSALPRRASRLAGQAYGQRNSPVRGSPTGRPTWLLRLPLGGSVTHDTAAHHPTVETWFPGFVPGWRSRRARRGLRQRPRRHLRASFQFLMPT